MKFILDSSVCVPILNGSEPELTARYVAASLADYAICSVIKAELLLGARRSTQADRALRRLDAFWNAMVSLPFDDLAAEHFGEIGSALKKAGKPIGIKDLMIAATARAHELTVITRNVSEFRRVPQLRLEQW